MSDAPAPVSDTDERLAGFLAHLAEERRLAPLTVENYARDVRDLLRLAAGRPLGGLVTQDLRRFVARLHGAGLGGRSLARKLSAWRAFFDYLVRDHGLAANPGRGLRAPRAPKRLPTTLSPDQAARLLDGVEQDDLAIRDLALLELVYSSGLRIGETLGLELHDLDLEARTVRVTGKGSRTRVVPVGTQASGVLAQWLARRPLWAAPDERRLFVSSRGGPLSAGSVRAQLRARALARGIEGRVYPHALRHSFASHVLQSSGDLRAVQELLGHASISTTQVYTHLDWQHLAKAYDAAHPRARRKPGD
jgi:integrase/recombinase XerC